MSDLLSLDELAEKSLSNLIRRYPNAKISETMETKIGAESGYIVKYSVPYQMGGLTLQGEYVTYLTYKNGISYNISTFQVDSPSGHSSKDQHILELMRDSFKTFTLED